MIITLSGRVRGGGRGGRAVNAANGDVLLVAQFHQCAIIGCGEPRCNCSIREQLDYRMLGPRLKIPISNNDWLIVWQM